MEYKGFWDGMNSQDAATDQRTMTSLNALNLLAAMQDRQSQIPLRELALQKGKLEVKQMQDAMDRLNRIRERIAAQRVAEAGGGAQPAPAGPPSVMRPPLSVQAPSPVVPTTGGPGALGTGTFGMGMDAPSAPPANPTGGVPPSLMAPPAAGGAPATPSPVSFKSKIADQYMATAKIFEDEGDIETAMKYREHAAKLMPEMFKIEKVLVNGKPRMVKVYKGGEQEDMGSSAPELRPIDLKDRVIMADQDDPRNANREFKVGRSPDNVASVGAQYAQMNQPHYDSSAQAWVTKPGKDGTSRVIVPGAAPGANPGALPNPKAREDIDNLRKEFNGLPAVREYTTQIPVLRSARNASDDAQGDIQLIYAVGKVLDPASVVREGEMNLIIKSGSPEDRIKGVLDYLQGGGRLTPQAREKLVKVMADRVGEQKKVYDQTRTTFENVVKKRGYDPKDVFTDLPSSADDRVTPAMIPGQGPAPQYSQSQIDAALKLKGVR